MCSTGFGRWILYGAKVEAERDRLHALVYPKVITPDHDYGSNDRNKLGLSILEKGMLYGSVGFDMDDMAKTLIDMSVPEELATLNDLLNEFRELNQSQGPNRD